MRVREGELDGLRWRRRLAPQYRGIHVQKSDDELCAAVQRCDLEEAFLKVYLGIAKQPGLTLQATDERCQVAIQNRTTDLRPDEPFPESDCCRVGHSLFDEVLDEVYAAGTFIDVPAEFGIECDRSF